MQTLNHPALKLGEHKFAALDSLRGIAALMVIMQHLWEINHPSELRLKPWLWFCAGHEAVIFFFVLSGFVLSHQLRNFQRAEYWQFVIKRIARIYPAYYLSLILAAGFLWATRVWHPGSLAGLGLTPWFYIWAHTSFDQTMLVGSLSLVLHEGNSLNVATWSLFYEMWLSLLFPFILSIINSRLWVKVMSSLSLCGVSYYLWYAAALLDNPWQSIIYYSWYFIAGSLVYRHYPRLISLATPGWLGLALLLYFSNFILSGALTSRLLHEIIVAVASVLVLANGIHNPQFKQFLAWWPWRFYGKISYSLYLLHLPVLYALAYWYLPGHNMISLKVLVVVITTGLATLSYWWVELPLLNFAKVKMGSRMVSHYAR
jgi:peptidoglycan/LPS O-acetylase OafA/YrhL